MDLDDIEVPQYILDGPKTTGVQQEKPKTKSRTSNFQITLDPNISASTLAGEKNKNERIRRYKQLIAIKMNLAAKFEAGELLKPFGYQKDDDWKAPRLTHVSGDPEYGPEFGRLHIHINVSFDNVCHIDNFALKSFVREATGDRGWNIKVQYIPDSLQLSRDYALKSSNPQHLAKLVDRFKEPIIG